MIITLNGVKLHLLPEKALFLPESKTLCLADWHLGKAAHFRKSGIPMPQPDQGQEFSSVAVLISTFQPETVVLLGDVFHSELNNDWIAFEEFIRSQQTTNWVITMGNHDIIGKARFEKLGILAVDEYRIGNGLLCTHLPVLVQDMLNISGHVHPGCELSTKARQYFRLPCFYYHDNVLTLPAFGSLTGLYMVKPGKNKKVFAIFGETIKEVR